MTKRNKKILFSFIVCSLLIALAWIFYCNFIITSRTISPNKKYEVSYNCFSKIVTIKNLNDNVKTYIVYGEDPVFLWSPDSKLLAVTYNTKNGNRWTQVAALEKSTSMSVPSKSQIQDLYNETRTSDKSNDNASITVEEWLDRSHALVKFSWPSDTQEKIISGWFVFECPSGTIEDFHIAQ